MGLSKRRNGLLNVLQAKPHVWETVLLRKSTIKFGSYNKNLRIERREACVSKRKGIAA